MNNCIKVDRDEKNLYFLLDDHSIWQLKLKSPDDRIDSSNITEVLVCSSSDTPGKLYSKIMSHSSSTPLPTSYFTALFSSCTTRVIDFQVSSSLIAALTNESNYCKVYIHNLESPKSQQELTFKSPATRGLVRLTALSLSQCSTLLVLAGTITPSTGEQSLPFLCACFRGADGRFTQSKLCVLEGSKGMLSWVGVLNKEQQQQQFVGLFDDEGNWKVLRIKRALENETHDSDWAVVGKKDRHHNGRVVACAVKEDGSVISVGEDLKVKLMSFNVV